jgi:dTMP kinase
MPRVIAFEGVDGAGKSTVIARVAERLRASGVAVCLPRAGKEHVSRPTRMIRELTRDRRNLDLGARSELLLYCAREAQVLEELVRPALRRGETVLVDRSLLTPVVLGRARGLSREECEAAARLAAGGLEPDLTLVFDVHPRTSRIRKRIEEVRSHASNEGGRKGLLGSAVRERVRDLYLEVAAVHGYPVFHCERAAPEVVAERVLRVVEHGPGAHVDEDDLDRVPQWKVPFGLDLDRALEALPLPVALFLGNGLVSARGLRAGASETEPALAAWSMDPADPLREAIAEREPAYALRAWNRRPLSGPDDLRVRLLARAPAACIGALKHLRDAESDALRERHVDSEPDAVLSSLTGAEDAAAASLRARAWPRGRDQARAASLAFCRGAEAWRLREEILERSPASALDSLRGIDDGRADALLERYAALAPKKVLGALSGRSDARAHALRDALFESGREVIDSVRGLDDLPSWALRERALERWPSTVAHSLLGLGADPCAQELVRRCAERARGDVHVLRRLRSLDERPAWPTWARQRAALSDGDGLDD